MANLTGMELGKYRITERIGRGGMAEVYKGIHTHLDRQVAIKVLHGHLLEGGDFVARFKREAKAVANLRHPNIVQVHDFDIQDDLIFMVMEYIDGTDLQSKLVELENKGEHLSIKEIGSIIKDIAGALDYAHSKDMLHRDVKPSNILIDQSGKAYLTDFGIARLLSDQKFTATGTLIGTPAYMSPEQGMGEEVSKESDIYSLGVVAFELITGQVPYDAQTPIAIVQKQIADPIPEIKKYVSDVPDTAQEVINTALAKEPESRYPSAEALVIALRGALEALEASEASLKITAAPAAKADDAALFSPTVEMQEEAVSEEFDKATVLMEEEAPARIEVAPAPERPPEVKVEEHPGERKPTFLSSTRNKVIVGVGGVIVIAAVLIGTGVLGVPSGTRSTDNPERAGQVSPDNLAGEQHFEEAVSLLNQNRTTEALEAFDAAIAAGYEIADVYHLRAFALLRLGEVHGAIESWSRAIELDETTHEYWSERGLARIKIGDLEGALADLTRAIEIYPLDPIAYRGRARVFNATGNLQEAIGDALEALRADPDNPESYTVLLEVYRVQDPSPHPDGEVMELTQAAIDRGLPFIEIHILRGLILAFRLGDETRAQIEFNLATEKAPENPIGYEFRGFFYQERGMFERAVEDYSHAIELAPDNPVLYIDRGDCFAALLRAELARQDYERFLEMTVDRPDYGDLRQAAMNAMASLEHPILTVSFDPENTDGALRLASGGDWDTQPVTAGPDRVPAWRSGNGEVIPANDGNTVNDFYIGFQVDDRFMFKGSPTTHAELIIEYLDSGTDTFLVQYDSTGTAWRNTRNITKTNTGVFKEAVFNLTDAYFGNRENDHDFRIYCNEDGAETIRRVTITLIIPEG